MNLLSSINYDPGTKRASIDKSSLDSLCSSLLMSTGISQISFTGVEPSLDDSDGNHSFQATSLDINGNDLCFPADKVDSVTCFLYQPDASPVLVISVSLKETWTFPDSLPRWSDPVWTDLVLRNGGANPPATLLLSTGTIQEPNLKINLSEGVSFYGTLDKSQGLLEAAGWIVGSAPVYGPTPISDTPSPISLQFNTGEINDGLIGLFKDQFHMSLGLELVYRPGDDASSGEMYLEASLGDLPEKLKASLPDAGTGVIEFSLDGPKDLTLADLEKNLGDVITKSIGDSIVTENIQNIGSSINTVLKDIRIGKLTFGIGLGTQKLEYVQVILTTPDGFTIPVVPNEPDYGEIEQIFFSASVYFGSSNPPYYSLGAKFEIGGVELVVSASLVPTNRIPEITFLMHLEESGSLDLTKILTKFKVPGADQFPAILVDEFQMSASTRGAYSVDVSFSEHPVTADHPLFLMKGLSLKLDYDKQLTYDIEGIVEIAESIVTISISSSDKGGCLIHGNIKGEPDQPLDMGALIVDLENLLGVTTPASIHGLDLEMLDFTYETTTKDFTFTLDGKIPASSASLDCNIKIQFQSGNGSTATFDGTLTIGRQKFNFDAKKQTKPGANGGGTQTISLIEANYKNEDGPIDLGELTQNEFSEISSLLTGVKIGLKDLLFALLKEDTSPSKYLFGIQLDMDFDLKQLPVAGKLLGDSEFSIKDLNFLIASDVFDVDEAGYFENTTMFPLPSPSDSGAAGGNAAKTVVLKKGINFKSTVTLGDPAHQQTMPQLPAASGAADPSEGQTTSTAGSSSAQPSNAQGTWLDINKTFGPINVARIGLNYKESRLWFLVSAGMSAGGLTIDLDGLGIGSKLNAFDLAFTLSGMSITFQGGDVEISGGLLAQNDFKKFIGEVLIEAESFSLSAFGEYEDNGDYKSCFIFAMLDDPLGGPPAFFVTGLAAGFGYHYKLNLPPPSKLSNFTLVKYALPGAGGSSASQQSQLASVLTDLQTNNDIVPDPGEDWLAVGIRFTSFEIIQSFALVTVSFGTQFEIALLGRSQISSPPGEPNPIAFAEIDLEAVILPYAKSPTPVLAVDGVLAAGSYIFDKACQLSGGFAFYVWGDTGEFVITFGGYHPHFNKPDYYPKVEHLGLAWKVNENLSIKGDMYFALTGSAIMAGGGLQAVYQTGSILVSFIAQSDFLLAWKPFHYEISISIQLSIALHLDLGLFTLNLSFHLGVNLELHGPPFGGVAHVDLDVISFSIPFGPDPVAAPALEWSEFAQGFLSPKKNPEDGYEIQRASVTGGLIKESDEFGWIINPRNFEITTHTVIPATEVGAVSIVKDRSTQKHISGVPAQSQSIGILPMGKTDIDSSHVIKLEKIGATNNNWSDQLIFEAQLGKSPKALYNNTEADHLSSDTMIDNTLIGIKIRPKAKNPNHTQEIPIKTLLFSNEIQEYQDFQVVAEKDKLMANSTTLAGQQDGPELSPESDLLSVIQGKFHVGTQITQA